MSSKQNSISMYQQISWKREKKFLEQGSVDNIQLKKQINKQSDMDSLVQTSINDKTYNLKMEATELSKKLQNQKYKNMQLETILKTMKIRMEDDKKSESTFINDSNSENNQTLQRKIKKFEYDLSQLNTRTNKVYSLVTEGKHHISLLRTERCIDSSIFRNIQKQLIQSEMDFKKLLIEKVRHQKIYNETLTQYNLLKSKALQFFQNLQTTRKASSLQETNLEENNQLMNIVKNTVRNNNFHSYHSQHQKNNKFKQISRPSQFLRQIFNSPIENNEEANHSNCQFSVKKLLLNLNITNQQEFVYLNDNIQKINTEYFKELNQKSDEITALEEQVLKFLTAVRQSGIKFYQLPPKMTKHQKSYENCIRLKNQIIKVKGETQQKTEMFNNFLNTSQFKNCMKNLQIESNEIPCGKEFDLQCFSILFQKIEERMNRLKYYSLTTMFNNCQQSILKTGRSEGQKKEQKLQDVMNRIKVHEQSDKIMRREDFREEYRKILEAGATMNSKQNLNRKNTKKMLF